MDHKPKGRYCIVVAVDQKHKLVFIDNLLTKYLLIVNHTVIGPFLIILENLK